MCSNYKTITALDHLVASFGVERPQDQTPPEFAAEIYPLKLAPFIRLSERGKRELAAGQFGLLPHWCKEVAYGRNTYNARSETVHSKPSFRDAWRRSQRCIIPAEKIYEPNYESGKPVRWATERVDGTPVGVAGIWTAHPSLTRQDGTPIDSFAMLTVNADGHPIFQRMHAPEDEKRMVVILDPEEYDEWLTCSPEEATHFFRQYHGALRCYADPRAARKPKARPDQD